jgi:putative hydrolase of the HAD superfamily
MIYFQINFLKFSSENESLRKPEIGFYEEILKKLKVKPSEIIYIGDSVKLDLEPALSIDINAWLIDRNNHYPNCSRKISSLFEIQNIL